MSVALIAEYGAFRSAEEEAEESGQNSMILRDTAKERILVKKEDRTSFSDDDLLKIKQIENVDYVVENDIFIDAYVSIQKVNEGGMINVSYGGACREIESFNKEIVYGRMPEEENEIIITLNENDYQLKNNRDEILNNKFTIYDPSGRAEIKDVMVVGISYNEKSYDYNASLYVSKDILDSLRTYMNKYYSKLTVFANNKYENYEVVPSDKVPKGGAIVNDANKYNYKNYRLKGTNIKISASNLYYEKELDIKITGTYTEANFKRVTGLKDYYRNYNTLFINTEDFNSMFDEPTYQISVYVKDKDIIDETIGTLKEIGLNTKKASDFEVNYNEEANKVIKIVRTVVTIIVLIVLFFISYFIIRVILKSRNTYFTTLRMLGANVKAIRRILDIELFNIYTISYTVLMLVVYLVNKNIINISLITKILKYITVKEYIIIYVGLSIMSILISRKVSKKIFKKTAISTYNEEV